AVPRRKESLRGGRQQSRERVVPESDVDHHGTGVAIVRIPGPGVQARTPMNPLIPELRPLGPSALGVTGAAEKDPDQPGVTRREALQAAAAAIVVLPAALAAQGQKVAAP